MFENDGKIPANGRPKKWAHWPSAVYHHLIPYSQIREVWNGLIGRGLVSQQRVYLDQVAANAPKGVVLPTIEFLDAIAKGQASDPKFELIATAIVWQPCNLAVGPKHRPAHPDPPEDQFDKLDVVPQHMRRLFTLQEASGSMTVFTDAIQNRSANSESDRNVDKAISSLQAVSHLGLIPQQDVNWYNLDSVRWQSLSPDERKVFDRYMDDSRLAKKDHELDGPQSKEYAEAALDYLMQKGVIAK